MCILKGVLNMAILDYVKENYELFDDLCARLQKEYNGDVEHFEQKEEDRLIIANLLEWVDRSDNNA